MQVDRDQPQHHDPGRPGGRRRTGRRRRDRRPREHLPPPGDGRGPPDGRPSTAPGRSPARSPRPPSPRSACSCRSASSAASSASSSCPSRSRSRSRCWRRWSCALTVVPVLAYLLIDKVKHQRRRGRRAEELLLDQAPTRRPSSSPCAAAGPSSASSASRRRCSWSRRALAPLLPTAFINAGSEKILQVTDRAARRRQLRGRPRADRSRPRRSSPPTRQVDLVQTTIPGEGDTGFQTLAAAHERPARQQRPDDRAARRRRRPQRGRARPSRTPWRRSRPTATTSRSPRRRASPRNGLTVIVAGDDAADVAHGERRGPRRARGQHPPAQPQVRPVDGHARDPGHARSEQGDRGRPHRRPGRAARSAAPSSAPRATRDRHRRAGNAVGRLRPGWTRRRRPPSTTSRPCRSARPPRCRSASVATVEQVEAQGCITRIDEAPAASITAEITSANTGAVAQGRPGRDRRPRRRRARSRPA